MSVFIIIKRVNEMLSIKRFDEIQFMNNEIREEQSNDHFSLNVTTIVFNLTASRIIQPVTDKLNYQIMISM